MRPSNPWLMQAWTMLSLPMSTTSTWRATMSTLGSGAASSSSSTLVHLRLHVILQHFMIKLVTLCIVVEWVARIVDLLDHELFTALEV